MFRSTLVIYTNIGDLERKRILLQQRLAKHRVNCGVRVGKVKPSAHKRPKGSLPVGLEFLAIDLCRIHRSNRHLAMLASRLPIVLKACANLGLFEDGTCVMRLLDITATTGADDGAFVRNFLFGPELLAELGQRGVSIRIDVPSLA